MSEKHDHYCECERRYGPRDPYALSEREMSEMRRTVHQAKKEEYWRQMMDSFSNPIAPVKEKKKMFQNTLSPSALLFREYGKVLYRNGLGMALSYKFTEWPEFLFEFKGDHLVILQKIGNSKNYSELRSFPIQAIRLSIGAELKDENDPLSRVLSMHADHDTSYYGDASLDSCTL